MITSIFPLKDATIYDKLTSRTQNTGLDQILEISKVEEEDLSYNSRALLQFDLTTISQSIVDGTISGSYKFYLETFASSIYEAAENYTIHGYPVSESWDSGIGKLMHTPTTTEGVSWGYRTDLLEWATGSYTGNVTSSYKNTSGGANWYTGSTYEASQSFTQLDTDINMDVTDIVNKWLTGTIANNGIILKLSDTDESSSDNLGVKRYFSTDTHTIYIPKLTIKWDDSTFTTGSLNALSDDNLVMYSKNLRQNYNTNSKTRVRINGRNRYEPRTFSTSSSYVSNYYLPSTSYYSIQDVVTSEEIVSFDDDYTKISCDTSGNYIDLWLSSFMVERFYKIIIKVVDSNGLENYYDEKMYFKVVR